jgi:hypothetical protein
VANSGRRLLTLPLNNVVLPQRCQISVTKHATNVGWITVNLLRTKRRYFYAQRSHISGTTPILEGALASPICPSVNNNM